MGKQPGRMEESVSKVLDAIPDDARALIVDELERRNPALLAELRAADEPTNDQSDGVVLGVLAPALRATFGPGHVPNEYGLAVERAIDAYLEAWPIPLIDTAVRSMTILRKLRRLRHLDKPLSDTERSVEPFAHRGSQPGPVLALDD